MRRRVTASQLPNDMDAFNAAWRELSDHVRSARSDVVVLPEMPFYPWVARTRDVRPAAWQAAVAAHDTWLERLGELGSGLVIASRPVLSGGHRLNEGFVWSSTDGYRPVHSKVYLPDEPGFWEASWYDRGPRAFEVVEVGGLRIGFLICTELWFTAHARDYAKGGLHLLVTPRATPLESVGKWVAGGRAAAVVAGAFGVSSNRGDRDAAGMAWGGAGWIVDPEGDVLAQTDARAPFCTVELDLDEAEAAKLTYPRYVED